MKDYPMFHIREIKAAFLLVVLHFTVVIGSSVMRAYLFP